MGRLISLRQLSSSAMSLRCSKGKDGSSMAVLSLIECCRFAFVVMPLVHRRQRMRRRCIGRIPFRPVYPIVSPLSHPVARGNHPLAFWPFLTPSFQKSLNPQFASRRDDAADVMTQELAC